MIKLFRNIRQKLIAEGKTTNYLKYAIGEIVLVVLGILIALSINNWHQETENKKLEKRYLTDLLDDLKKDSISLKNLYLESIQASQSKDSIIKLLNNREYHLDSLSNHFKLQWNSYKIFTPNETTIEEMKSSSNLNIIKNDALRRNIVSLYGHYQTFLQDEELYMASTREIFSLAKSNLLNINNPSQEEIKLLLQNPRISNTIRKNFANGRMLSIGKISIVCHNVMKNIRYELEKSR